MGPTTARVDNKGIIGGLWSREMKCIGPKAKDADLWIWMWEEVLRMCEQGVPLEVGHEEKQEMSLFDRFVTESNEKADELANDGAMLDG